MIESNPNAHEETAKVDFALCAAPDHQKIQVDQRFDLEGGLITTGAHRMQMAASASNM